MKVRAEETGLAFASNAGSDWRSCCALHSNRMVLDESVMARGAALRTALAERFLAVGFGE